MTHGSLWVLIRGLLHDSILILLDSTVFGVYLTQLALKETLSIPNNAASVPATDLGSPNLSPLDPEKPSRNVHRRLRAGG